MRPTQLLLKGRSAWKGPYFVAFSGLREAIINHVPIYTKARSCTILPNFVGAKFLDMIGHKLGEFSHTRKSAIHTWYFLHIFLS
ncbi:hypothetical protein BDQ17DRAFT_1395294 [Cyathus striatus]|nr:hypothetical protein BDQ17DRAFT_1395294 [Cyathus striatus]